ERVTVVRLRREPAGELEQLAQVVIAHGELVDRLPQLLVRAPYLLDSLPRALQVLADREHEEPGRDRERDQPGEADAVVGDRRRQRERSEREVDRQPAQALATDRE